MHTLAASPVTSPSVRHGWLRFSLVRIVLGALAVIVPVALTMVLVHQLVDKSVRGLWPQLVAAALCVAGYRLYVRKVERSAVEVFARAGAGRELGLGLLLGAGLFLAVIGVLAAAGAWQLTGSNAWTAILVPLTELTLVALFEEILFRAILLRNIERSLGTWAAIAISSLVFGLAHVPNANVTPLAIGVTIVAGVWLAGAYLATRRLWLAVGMHFAWNFMSDAVFSLTTSGHPGKGMLQGRTGGPAWLSGGAYGVEASLVTLVVLAAASVALLAVARRRGHLLGRVEAGAARAAGA